VATSSTFTARDYATGRSYSVAIESGVLAFVTPAADAPPNRFFAPSFFDPQINGCLGIGFSSPTLTVDEVYAVVAECAKHGIGGFCPTVITAGIDTIRHAFATLVQARDVTHRIPYFHLEGPYISTDDGPRGAHPKEHVRNPDWAEFQWWQDVADGRIRMVTLAPERPGAIRFIGQLVNNGVVAALGHTAATAEQIRDAVAAGATVSTHLGNGCQAMVDRHDNPIWEQLSRDELLASVIADGHHLPPAVLKVLARGKGPGRIFLTADTGPLAGLAPGRYRHWGQELEVLPGGKIVVPGTPYLAGGGHFLDTCVANLIRIAGWSLKDAVDAASIRPRELLGLAVPKLAAGEPADFVVFDWEPGGKLKVVT
jgi:N-acetylglucosamine-6-phosphate deacetylase